MATEVASTPELTLWQRMELAELLQIAHRQAVEGYRFDRDLAREVEAADLGDVPDVADLAEVERERDDLLEASETELELLHEIEDATERMQAGCYGRCLECGEPIPYERLKALPWSRFCAEHQTSFEAEDARRPPPRRRAIAARR